MSTQTKRGFEAWATARHRAGLPYSTYQTRLTSDGRVKSTAADFSGMDWLSLGGLAGVVAPLLAGIGGSGAGAAAASGPMSLNPAVVGTGAALSGPATAGAVGTGAASMPGWLNTVKQIAPLALAGASLFSKGDQQAQQQLQRQNSIAEEMQRLQLQRMKQTDPLYQAILQMAMQLMPKGGGF